MCYWTFVISDCCAYVFDPEFGSRRLRTKSEGFFEHGFWRKRTDPLENPCQAQCCNIPAKPKYRDVINPRKSHLEWDMEQHRSRDVNGNRIPDYRCEPCRDRKDRCASGGQSVGGCDEEIWDVGIWVTILSFEDLEIMSTDKNYDEWIYWTDSQCAHRGHYSHRPEAIQAPREMGHPIVTAGLLLLPLDGHAAAEPHR